jgi:NAD(P)-dependent dehydrogenase (short-subunit alcohol dehydrogenase family)
MGRQASLSPVPTPPNLAAFRLDGRLALVTGASRGIGRGCALALADAGADIALMGRNRADLEAAAGEIEAAGRRAHILACDVTQLTSLHAALDRLPRIDIRVHNAGAKVPQPFFDVDEATFDRLFTLNFKAVFFLTQAVADRMKQKRIAGSIINMSSQAGHIALPDRSVYCSTKHALEGFSKTIAVELAPYGIRVNTVAPTFIETPMTRQYLTGAFADFAQARIPLGRFGQVEDVVGAVLYLAAPASGLVTGTCLKVDGGWTAQ